MKQSVINRFDGQEVNPADLVDKDRVFDFYLPTLANACPSKFDNDEEKTWWLKRYSAQLANNRMIEYKGEHDRIISRHLSRDEYDRVNLERIQLGTGQLRPYSEVKIHDFPDDKGGVVRNIAAVTAHAVHSMYQPEADYETVTAIVSEEKLGLDSDF